MGVRGMVFRVWVHERAPFNSHWLVLTDRIGGANFLHCWVTDYSSFNGGLFRALTNFTVVLPVNNSLVHHLRPASSWPRNSLS